MNNTYTENKPSFWLCRPNKKRIAKLKDIYNENLSTKENALHELSFTIPTEVERNHELIPNPLLELLRGYYLVEMKRNDKIEYFVLTNDSGTLSKDGVEKSFTLYSYAHKLAKKFVRNYIPEQPQTLSKYVTDFLSETSWSVGSVNVDFDLKYRTHEVSTSSVLQCLFDIAEKFDAMVEFDTVMKRVNFYKVERGMNRGLRFKEGIYLESFDVKFDYDTIVTRLKCYGQDGLEFRSLSPTGSNYIEDFSWFMYPFECDENYNVIARSNYMTDELCIALTKYNKLLAEKDGVFNSLVGQRTNLQSELTVLNEQMNTLVNQLKILTNELDVINSTYGDTATSRQDYQACIANISNKKIEIDSKQIDIVNKKNEIDLVDLETINLQSLLLIENNFTSDELIELDEFIIESEYINDSITNEEDLLDEGLRAFEELKSPTISLNLGLANFLNTLENDINRDKLILGDTVRFKSEKLNLQLVARMSEKNENFESGDISVTITNTKNSKDEFSRLKDMIYGSATTSNTVNMDKFKWNKAVNQSDDVSKILNNTFDATLQGIKGGVNSTVTWNERGIFAQSISDPNRMLVIQGGHLALSNDSLQSLSVAINPDGIFADKLISRIILSNKLHIEDLLGIVKIENGTVTTFDDSGKITTQLGLYPDPNDETQSKYGLRIYDGAFDLRSTSENNKGIQIDVNGIRGFNSNGVKSFEIDAATGIATLQNNFVVQSSSNSNSGFKINETGIHGYNSSGVRTFHVDTNGYLTATSGTFSGTIIGGQIISNTSIEVTTDVNVGNKLYIGTNDQNINPSVHFTSKYNNPYLSGYITYHTELAKLEIASPESYYGTIHFNADVLDFNNATVQNLQVTAVFG